MGANAAEFRGVSLTSPSPLFDANHVRLKSTKLTKQMGTSKIRAARAVSLSKDPLRPVSKIR